MRRSVKEEVEKIPALYACCAILALLLITLLISYYAYKRVFFHLPHEANPYKGIDKPSVLPFREACIGMTDRMCARECDFIYLTAPDGARLRARLYLSREGAPFIIQCHGYKSTPLRDFAGIGETCLELGYNLLMVDHRAHGGSDGRAISFGRRESADCLLWISYINERFGEDKKIILQGISMGAATVILAAAEKTLPKNVAAVMADCPYSSAKDIIIKVMKDMKIPRIIYLPVRLGGLLFGRFDPSKIDVARAAANSRVPILLIHGEADGFVPHYMSEKIALSPKVEFHSFPGADHGISYLVDTERYRTLSADFLEKYAPINNENEVTPYAE